MNIFNKILVIVFSLALLTFACEEKDVVAPEETEETEETETFSLVYEGATNIEFPAENGDTLITVTATGGLYIATVADDGKDWCTVSSITLNNFKISYTENENVESRSTKITLSMSKDEVNDIEITVTQFGASLIEQWLNIRLMKEYYIGDDVREVDGWETHPFGYWGIIAKLFDSIAFCLQPTEMVASANYFATVGTNSATGEPYLMPIHFTMDLGVTAYVSRFWVAPKTHSRVDRFWEYSIAALYDFQLWGTTTDFGENSPDYIPANSTYWTEGEWMRDPRWKNMGRYLNKRHNVPNDTPGNLSSEPPNNPGSAANWLDRDPAWTESRRIREMGNGYRYLADGSGPVKNDGIYFPDAGWHFAITEAGVGPVRYVRWQIHETWGQNNWIQFQELWYWGGIISK